MHATTLTAPALKVLYALCGETFLPQKNLELLEGYKGSQPVRTGNRAYTQYQLDIYGEVLDSLLLYVQGGGAVDREMGRRLIEMADLVVSEWSLPDHGIWEVAGPRRHYVHSKVMCWVALDRAKQIVQRLHLRADLHAWEKAGDAIRQCVRDGGFSSRLKSFVQTLGGEHVDATALTFSLSGFVDPHDPGMISTIDVVRNTLGRKDLLYRYLMEDGLPGQEGAFLACSFWLVEALAVTGRTHEAEKLFEKLHERANDVGLYPEQVLPSDGRMLGNFPQALTHLSHISAALRLYSR
jgi:GH15 family glucan-1,4-alpha-glucosidase